MNDSTNPVAISSLIQRHEVTITCEKHGSVIANRITLPGGKTIPPSCPVCAKDREEAEKAAAAQQRAAAHAAAAADRRRRAISDSGVMPRFADKGLSSYSPDSEDQARAKAIAEQYVAEIQQNASDGMGLILSGGVGVGKTHLSSAIAVAAIDLGYSVQYMTCQDMISAIRDTWRKTSEESETQVIRRLSRDIDFMVIDEVGVQRGTDEEKNLMFRIMDARYGHKKPTIILTNCEADGLKEFLGERIYDRLRECCKWVPIHSKSHRGSARRAALQEATK